MTDHSEKQIVFFKRGKSLASCQTVSDVQVPLTGRLETPVTEQPVSAPHVVNTERTRVISYIRTLMNCFQCAEKSQEKAKLILRALVSGMLWSALFTLIYWIIGMLFCGWFIWMLACKYYCLCHGDIAHFVQRGTVRYPNKVADTGFMETYLDHSANMSKEVFFMYVSVAQKCNISLLDLIELSYLDQHGNVSRSSLAAYGDSTDASSSDVVISNNFTVMNSVQPDDGRRGEMVTHRNIAAQRESIEFLFHNQNITVLAMFLSQIETQCDTNAYCPNHAAMFHLPSCNMLFDKSCGNCQVSDFFAMTFFGLFVTGGSFGYFIIWISKCYR